MDVLEARMNFYINQSQNQKQIYSKCLQFWILGLLTVINLNWIVLVFGRGHSSAAGVLWSPRTRTGRRNPKSETPHDGTQNGDLLEIIANNDRFIIQYRKMFMWLGRMWSWALNMNIVRTYQGTSTYIKVRLEVGIHGMKWTLEF